MNKRRSAAEAKKGSSGNAVLSPLHPSRKCGMRVWRHINNIKTRRPRAPLSTKEMSSD